MLLNGVNSTPMDNNIETHYGIWYPKSCFTLDFDESECLPLVVKSYEEVKVIVKKYKSCRFKATKSREEALVFAKMPPEQILSPYIIKKVNGEEEKGSAFRAPKPQEIVKLRLAIDHGDEETFKDTVWKNPRYLIGQADNPTIFHDGARYNALHIAAKSKNGSKMCRLLLETIENPAFMQLMYSDERPADCMRRTKYLVDLYLNMRDKGLNETPLHFAAKFGAVEVVSILVSHPACDQTLENKFGNTAKAVALSRCHPQAVTPELKAAMAKAFEEKYFVAILVNSDESSPPYVSEPMSPAKRNRTLEELVLEKQSNSSILATPVMRAVAGPMSENEAKDFHRMLKSPSRLIPPQTFRSIKLSDMEKGYERIGRCHAKRMNVEWKEQWPFGYCDVSKESGLEKLEHFLKLRWEELLLKVEELTNHSAECSFNSDDFNNSFMDSEISPITNLCRRLENLELSSPIKGPTMVLFPDINNEAADDYNNVELENDYALRLCKDIARKLGETMEKEYYLNDEDIRDLLASFNCLQNSHGVNGSLKGVHGQIAELLAQDIDYNVNFCQTTFLTEAMADTSFDEKNYRVHNYYLNREQVLSNFIQLEEHVSCIFNQLRLLCEEFQMETQRFCTCTWADDSTEEEFFTPPSSPTHSSSDSDDEYLSPSEELDLFMNGMTPSKLDLDVLRALADTQINPLLYPNIHKWKCIVDSYSLEETEKWKGLMTPKKKVEDSNMRNNGSPRSSTAPIPILNFSPVNKHINNNC